MMSITIISFVLLLMILNCHAAIVDLIVIEGQNAACPRQYEKIATSDSLNGDFNQGAGGSDIWLCIKSSLDEQPITGLVVVAEDSKEDGCGDLDVSWHRISEEQGSNGDFNHGAGGKYIYICYRKEAGEAALLDMSIHEQDCDNGMLRMNQDKDSNGDFNQGSGGKSIYMCAAWQPQPKPSLQLKSDSTFKLALFCDMHFGEDVNKKDGKSVAFERKILGLERPNLVVIDGDASSNYAAPSCHGNACKHWFLSNWKRFTSQMELAGVPYAYTLGNHDRIPGPSPGSEAGNETNYAVPDRWIIDEDMFNPHALAEDGPDSIHGASNYVLPVHSSDGKPVAYVWMLDSSDNNCMGTKGWGCVYPDQVEWYRQTSKQLADKDGKVLPGVMFHHIPLVEVNAAWNDATVEVNGTKGEDVCCFSVNTGLFEAIKEVGNIWGVFHGHDHNNDFVAYYQGVYIGYGRKSGYGGYGGKVADRPGSRIIELTYKDGLVSWETWIRLDSGEKVVQGKASRGRPQSKCCGMALSSAPQTPTDKVLASQVCRVFDEAAACRVAAGLDGAETVAFV